MGDVALLRQDNARLSDHLLIQSREVGELRDARSRLTAERDAAHASIPAAQTVTVWQRWRSRFWRLDLLSLGSGCANANADVASEGLSAHNRRDGLTRNQR